MSGIRDAASPSRDGSEDSGQAIEDPHPDNNLPLALTSFVGREREVAEVNGRLGTERLLTLVGPGGSGKTRLALAVAVDVARNFENGVWLVELASLSDPDLVPQAVASVLGVRETPGTPPVDALVAQLEPRNVLLILDNCEHLIDACASLAGALLRRCPDLSVLATSREALGVSGETLFAVPPLSLPDPHYLQAFEVLSRYEASRLFVERAMAVRQDFAPTEENAIAVAQVCYRLDGMPLAIELAAARTRVLSVKQISERLDRSFRLLSGGGRAAIPRHRTLRATMDWSHGLLPEQERVVLRRLSVFSGGFSLEAAEVVSAGGGIGETVVLELLSSLVDKSLVLVQERDGRARYRLLETVRQYAAEKLEEAGEETGVRRRHAAYFLGFAEMAEPELKGTEQEEWLGRLETENDNLRTAIRFLLDANEADDSLHLAWALWLFWWYRGHHQEGRGFADEMLAKGYPLSVGQRARVAWIRGVTSYGRESAEEAALLCQESVDLFREAGDQTNLALTLMGASVTWLQAGNADRASALLEEATALHRRLGDPWGISVAVAHLGMVYLKQGNRERAVPYLEEGQTISEEIHNGIAGHMAAYNLALLAEAEGHHGRAVELHAEGIGFAMEVGDVANAAYSLEGLAEGSASMGDPERAAQLFGASEALLETVGAPRYVHAQDPASLERVVEELRLRLGEEAFGAVWAEGRGMSLERAIEYGLREPVQPEGAVEAPPDYPADLSAREVEVLRLVAKGLTNAQVANELYISSRTVNAHMGSVYNKIGSNTRAEATRFALEHGLL